jgi:hypothetical protein
MPEQAGGKLSAGRWHADLPGSAAASAVSKGNGMQGQAHARSHHCAVDADVLQISPQQQLELTRRLSGVPVLDGPGDEARKFVVELVGERPGSRFDHAFNAVHEGTV